ncbi:hypothetical protein MBANPS3_007559 [Mucor bainieri]
MMSAGEGEKALTSESVLFKLDAKLVLLYDDEKYPLTVEAKVILNNVAKMNLTERNITSRKIVNMQVIGLETYLLALDSHHELYCGRSIETFFIPSAIPKLKKEAENVVRNLYDYKTFAMNTAEIIKETLNEKTIIKRSMKRKLLEETIDSTKLPLQTIKPDLKSRHDTERSKEIVHIIPNFVCLANPLLRNFYLQ